jgi:hypothetical protein
MRKNRANHPGKAWLEWCSANADKLPLPIKRTWWHGDVARLKFEGAHPNLEIIASRNHDILTSVTWKQCACWDIVTCTEAAPKQTIDGRWFCDWCCPEERSYFGTLQEFLVAHQFEPWAEKMRSLFANESWAAIGGTGGATWVDLIHSSKAPSTCAEDWCKALFRTCIEPQLLKPASYPKIDSSDY